MRILIVEPNARERGYLADIFRSKPSSLGENATQAKKLQYNYEVHEAADNKSALTVIAELHPDLVLIGVRHQLKEAQELCQVIRQREDERHTGIIFLAHDPEHGEFLPVECLEVGGDDFIPASMTPREVIARVNVVLRMKAMTDELRSANHKLEILSMTDDLTGLHNMRSFNLHYTKMLRQCRRGATGLGVIMLDLDHFKMVNDEANHLVGSYVISQVGRLIGQADFFALETCSARYGGDEFIVVLYADSAQEVVTAAEKLRHLISHEKFKKDDYCGHITCSVGVSWIEPGFEGKPDDPIKAADVMLYRSKGRGRNQVSGMVLRYPIDFDHISRTHLIQGDTSGDDDGVSSFHNLKVFK